MVPTTPKRELSESWQQVEQKLGYRPVLHGTIDELREQFKAIGASASQHSSSDPSSSSAVHATDHTLPHFRVRVYRPQAVPADEDLPIGVFSHGGGWIAGDVDTEDGFCRGIVKRVKTVLVSVEYRLAPEWRAPTQLEDMIEGFKWAHDNAASFAGDKNKMYTMGDSAGGALALALARKILLGQGQVPSTAIKGICALVPMVFSPQHVPEKYTSSYRSYTQNSTDVPFIDRHSLDTSWELSRMKAVGDENLVGEDMDSHALFPATYIATCEFDPLRDDGVILEMCLREKERMVKRDHYERMPHAFWYVPGLPENEGFMDNTVNGMEWIIAQM